MGSRDVKGYDVIGDTVNTAKRICQAAGTGEILISDSVRQMMGGDSVLGDARHIVAKGKSERLTVYAVEALLKNG